MIVIGIKGKPYEMGKQYGRQLANLIRRHIDHLWSAYQGLGYTKDDVYIIAELFEDGIRKNMPELLDELTGIAHGAHVKFEDVVAANLFYELLHTQPVERITRFFGWGEECTSVAAIGDATADKKSIAGMNVDATSRDRTERIIVSAKPSGYNSYLSEGSPLIAGIKGINNKGLTLVGAGVQTSDGVKAYMQRKTVGIPVLLLSKVVHERCNNIGEAIQLLKEIKLRGYLGQNLVMVDSKDNIACVEISYEKLNIRKQYPDNIIAATNHFSSKELNHICPSPEQMPSSHKRYDRAMELLMSYTGEISPETIKTIQRDHVNGPGPNSICEHGTTRTLMAIILQPAKLRLWASPGNPCVNEYISLKLE